MITFNLTAELVTEDSCRNGDAEKRGFLDESGQLTDKKDNYTFSLRELCEEGLQCLYWEDCGDWITTTCEASYWLASIENIWSFMDDDSVDSEVLSGSISVHRPEDITDASWERVVKHLQEVK